MRTKKVNRSIGGNILVFLLLLICGAFMVLPLYLTVVHAFKPLSELFIFPPRFYVVNPTMDNFSDMMTLIQAMRVPFERWPSIASGARRCLSTW